MSNANKSESDSIEPVMRNCAACGEEKQLEGMKTCMDSRQMHRYVCDTQCMADFYA